MIIISSINFKQWLVGYHEIILTSHIKEYIENTQKLNHLITANGTTHCSWEKCSHFADPISKCIFFYEIIPEICPQGSSGQ